MIDLKTKSTGEVGVFQWNLPTQPRVLLCSPEFRKFDRTWRLLLDDKTVALEFSQGVKPIYMDLRYKKCDLNLHYWLHFLPYVLFKQKICESDWIFFVSVELIVS